MAIYEYCCETHGNFEVIRPGGSATATTACPTCAEQAVRVMTAPAIRRAANLALHASLDRAQKSRFEPEVVTSLPTKGHRRPPPRVARMTPQLAALPRP